MRTVQQQSGANLLACTGGHLYYDQLWDVGLKYSNYILNTNKWADCESPISRLSGTVHYRSKNLHVFGAYCLFHVPKELRDGKFRPPSEMGIWVGLDSAVHNGHLVVPIEWQHSTQSWLLSGVVTATTVKVYEDVFPLRKAPPPGALGTVKFDEFVDKLVEPLYSNRPNELEVEQPMVVPKAAPQSRAKGKRQTPQYRNPNKVKGPKPVSGSVQCEIAKIVDSRIVKASPGSVGVKQYRVQWKGYPSSANSWVKSTDVHSPRLVLEYNRLQTGRSQADIASAVAMHLMQRQCGADSQAYNSESTGVGSAPALPGLDVGRAVESLMRKQGLEGGADKFAEGLNTELAHMLDKRLQLITDPREAARILVTEPVVSLRMQLEVKKLL